LKHAYHRPEEVIQAGDKIMQHENNKLIHTWDNLLVYLLMKRVTELGIVISLQIRSTKLYPTFYWQG